MTVAKTGSGGPFTLAGDTNPKRETLVPGQHSRATG